MISSSRQLKDKIRNLSAANGADAQILIRNYIMERFLERVAVSDYREHFILKGGMLVTSMVGIRSRSTMDIDVTAQGVPVNQEEVRCFIEKISSIDLSDGVSFYIKNIDSIMDDADYPGIRVGLNSFMDRVRVPLKIDISTGDAITPRDIKYSYNLMFENRSINLLAYNLETVLAEKLESIITRAETNTRMRDFYDIHILSTLYYTKIDSVTLSNALKNTSRKRGSLARLQDADDVLASLRTDENMQTLWQNYQSKFNYAANISWDTILNSVCQISRTANRSISIDDPPGTDDPNEPSRDDEEWGER